MRARRLTVLVAVAATLLSALALVGAVPSAPVPRAEAATVLGQPPKNFSVLPGSYFSFPNRSSADRTNIRNRVLYTVQSVWGGHRNRYRDPIGGNGSIRMATWSFNDWTMAHALVAARNRGVTVQIVAAQSANEDFAPWQWLKRQLGSSLYTPGHPESRDKHSYARECRGSCRGYGGTPHSKFYLFDNVGAGHHRSIVMQSSMNLTQFAMDGQWNQAQVIWNPAAYSHFHAIQYSMATGVGQRYPYREYSSANFVDMFFPRPGTSASTDPVMRTLSHVSCSGAASGGTNGHTKIRIINYAIYDTRGVWLARRLRYLWNAGCDVAIIYSLSTRPVIGILRSTSGRGPIPMRQSVITNGAREIVKYNHSKWMTITGKWGNDANARLVLSGSANWSNSAFGNDEQWQLIKSSAFAGAFLSNFTATWNQSSSHLPGFGVPPSDDRAMRAARSMSAATAAQGQGGYAPGNTIPFGRGAYKHLSADE